MKPERPQSFSVEILVRKGCCVIPLHERLLTFVETELLADFPPCDIAGELQQLSEELIPGWQGVRLMAPPEIKHELKPRRKLTAEIARSVRSSTDTGKELAARFGVSQATISQIRRGHTWRDA